MKDLGLNTGQLLEKNSCHECLKEQNWYCCHMETFRGPPLHVGGNGPRIHYTHIAPGNELKDSRMNDIVSQKDGGVLDFEAEVAGLSNSFPCLTIRGVCDNGETNSTEQSTYAATVAAAYARDLLLSVSLEVLRFLCATCAIDDSKYTLSLLSTAEPRLQTNKIPECRIPK